MTPTEEQEQAKLCEWLTLKKAYFFAVPNANAMSSLSPKMAMMINAKLKKTGFRSGVSDLVVFTPERILFVEMKRAKKSLSSVSENQKQFIEKVNRYGYSIGAVCYGFEEAKAFIEQYL